MPKYINFLFHVNRHDSVSKDTATDFHNIGPTAGAVASWRMKTKRRSGMYQKASDPNRIKDLLMLCCQAFIELKNVQFWKKASNAAKDFKENNNSSLKRWNTNIYLLFILTFLVISKVCAWKGKTKISNDNEICISTAHKKNSFVLSFSGIIQKPSYPSHQRYFSLNKFN